MVGNPYDEVPYRSMPIEWTAPERLALASRLHGGPRPTLASGRVLELGCGDGANLLPLAYYRRNACFVGIDGAGTQIALARARCSRLRLDNVEFMHVDFEAAASVLTGKFDYVIAHGVFSWVPDSVRDAVLSLCTRCLTNSGLLYLNYNTKPGWNVRGMIRDFLLAQTAATPELRLRAEQSREVASRLLSSLQPLQHPYSQLIANEFRFVCESDISYIAHEFLSPDNNAYWRSDFLSLLQSHGLHYVADADFNYASGRVPRELEPGLDDAQIYGRSPQDTLDLLCYRQLHSPILTMGHVEKPTLPDDLSDLWMSSCLEPCDSSASPCSTFRHPSGFEVEAKEAPVWVALDRLRRIWPRGESVASLFGDHTNVASDLRLLQLHGLIELRNVQPWTINVDPRPLNTLEAKWGNYVTTAYHTREAPPVIQSKRRGAVRRLVAETRGA